MAGKPLSGDGRCRLGSRNMNSNEREKLITSPYKFGRRRGKTGTREFALRRISVPSRLCFFFRFSFFGPGFVWSSLFLSVCLFFACSCISLCVSHSPSLWAFSRSPRAVSGLFGKSRLPAFPLRTGYGPFCLLRRAVFVRPRVFGCRPVLIVHFLLYLGTRWLAFYFLRSWFVSGDGWDRSAGFYRIPHLRLPT